MVNPALRTIAFSTVRLLLYVDVAGRYFIVSTQNAAAKVILFAPSVSLLDKLLFLPGPSASTWTLRKGSPDQESECRRPYRCSLSDQICLSNFSPSILIFMAKLSALRVEVLFRSALLVGTSFRNSVVREK